jgi:hypothetical protein
MNNTRALEICNEFNTILDHYNHISSWTLMNIRNIGGPDKLTLPEYQRYVDKHAPDFITRYITLLEQTD